MNTTILIDMDGVLCDWSGGIERGLRVRGLDPDECTDRTRWDLGMDEATTTAVHEIRAEPGFYLGLDPIPGAIEAMSLIAADPRFDAYICSTPDPLNPTCASDKIAWVERHLGAHWVTSIILAHDKTLVRGDLLLDDKPRVFGLMRPSWQQLIFDQPYNVWAEGAHLENWDTFINVRYPAYEGAAA